MRWSPLSGRRPRRGGRITERNKYGVCFSIPFYCAHNRDDPARQRSPLCVCVCARANAARNNRPNMIKSHVQPWENGCAEGKKWRFTIKCTELCALSAGRPIASSALFTSTLYILINDARGTAKPKSKGIDRPEMPARIAEIKKNYRQNERTWRWSAMKWTHRSGSKRL